MCTAHFLYGSNSRRLTAWDVPTRPELGESAGVSRSLLKDCLAVRSRLADTAAMEVLVGVLVSVLRAGACGLRYRVTGRDWADPVSAADGPEGGTSPASSSSAPAPVVRAKPYDIPAPGDDAPNTCTKVTSTGLATCPG